MNTEFAIDINGIQRKIYMQTGFVDHADMRFPLHTHSMTEIHILICGKAALKCRNESIVMHEGDVLCVPAGVLHTYHSVEKAAKRITFFADRDVTPETLRKIKISQALIEMLCREIGEYVLTGKDNKLKPLLSYICADLFPEDLPRAQIPLSNRRLMIEDFFSRRYSESVTLEDLAKDLMLSRKQTEREVKRFTGNTFSEELSKRRLNAAMILLQTTNLPLTKIGELVGYASYSGLYKAMKRRNGSFSRDGC